MTVHVTDSSAPAIPERLHRLPELATDLWWTWNAKPRQVFRMLDYPLWRQTAHNPVLMLRLITPDLLARAAGEERRQRGGDGAGGGALAHHVDAIGDEPHRRGGFGQRDDQRLGHPSLQQRPHRLEHRLAAGAIDKRWFPRIEAAGFASLERER